MKNGKKDMSDKLKLKGHMKVFMRWPLILSALLIVLIICTSYVYDAIHPGLILKMINAAPHLAEQHFCIIYENCYRTE